MNRRSGLLDSPSDVVDMFLAAEQDPRLLEWEESGLKVWPIVRTPLLFRLLNGEGSSSDKGRELPASPAECLNLAGSVWKIVRFSESHRFAVFSDAVSRRLETPRGWLDVTYDLLADCTEDAVFFERRHFKDYWRPHWTPRVVSADGIEVLALLKGFGSRLSKRVVMHMPHGVVSLARTVLGRSADIDGLVSYVGYVAARSIASYAIYLGLLRRVQPRLVLVDSASYGGSRAVLCKACHDLGIPSAEAQHGVVNQYHPAYNYGSTARGLCEYLPESFLVYGDYWAGLLRRFPPAKVVIGNPLMCEWMASHPWRSGDSARTILFVSQPEVSEMMTALLVDAARSLRGDYQLVFRPHPAEVLSEGQRRKLGAAGAIVDRSSHIYELLSRCGIVVGSHSTVLFESRAFRKTILVLDSPKSRAYIPTQFGWFISSSEEIVDAVRSSGDGRGAEDDASLWAPDWRGNFGEFLKASVR